MAKNAILIKMTKRSLPQKEVTFEKIVGGGQALGTLDDGRKLFAWGGLPDETAIVQLTKKKSNLAEGFVVEVLAPSADRIEPQDPSSYLSTSPWQVMHFDAEQRYKAALIEEAFELHDVVLPNPIEVYTDGREYHYRNKVEFSWYGQTNEDGTEQLDLAFFRRGSKGKVVVDESSLMPKNITALSHQIRDFLQANNVSARNLKTLLIRSDALGNCVWQLYVKETDFADLSIFDTAPFTAQGGEVIYSNPKSPASVITERLLSIGNVVLQDTILTIPFRYATEGFFQINLPVYEQALKDMREWVPAGKPVVDMYSGVGSIGLTIGGDNVTLVEVNEHAVREMQQNITKLGLNATPVLAASEHALDYIEAGKTIIVDPPRAGLHEDVTNKLLEEKPERIIYLSCNPVTQARDVARLGEIYGIRAHKGYNFFPRTPHIENLVILDLKQPPIAL
jgi:23S rRNA (uracil1939-C5)-methyltransferase